MPKISLAAARVNAGMTQEDVSKIMRVSRTTVINWEKGKKSPKPAEFMMLCHLYNIGEDFISLPED